MLETVTAIIAWIAGNVILRTCVGIIAGIAAVFASVFLVVWLAGFLKCLWEHYPEIKKKINDFIIEGKNHALVTIDRIENSGYQTAGYMLKVSGIEKKREKTICQKPISLEEMHAMGYQGGDHYETKISTKQ